MAAGGVLIAAGATGDGLGILMEGRASASVTDSGSGTRTRLYGVEPGDHFGEVGLLLDESQPHDVVADEACLALLLRRQAVDQLCEKVPAFAQALAASLAERLRSSTSRPPPPPRREQPDTPFVRVSSYSMSDEAVDLVSARLVEQHRFVPLALRDGRLTIGMVDPFNEVAVREIRRVLGKVELEVVAISLDDFTSAARRLRIRPSPRRGYQEQGVDPNAIAFDEADSRRESDRTLQRAGEQVVALAARVIAAGLDRGASDIHIEPNRRGVRIRYRVNGVLTDWEQTVNPALARPLIARFKVLAGLDIAERRRPQDGRIGLRVGRRQVDLRVSTLPSSDGEKLALRILEAAAMLRSLDDIFVEPRTLSAIQEALQRPYGAIVVAGPTGSGKTSTLYAALHERRTTRPDTNVITAEDPIEYRLDGVTQVQVNHAVGLGFAEILRAMLRQDPDVLMVGEIRDAETAQLALESSMTGHVVLTSIHASEASAVIQRFENFGCDRPIIAQSTALVLVQRLSRRLCSRCVVDAPVPALMRESLIARDLYAPSDTALLPRAAGCDACDHTGYVGRVAVLESLQLTDPIRSMLMANRSLDEVMKLAAEERAWIRFSEYAAHMMRQGVIGPAEALLAVAS